MQILPPIPLAPLLNHLLEPIPKRPQLRRHGVGQRGKEGRLYSNPQCSPARDGTTKLSGPGAGGCSGLTAHGGFSMVMARERRVAPLGGDAGINATEAL